MSEKFEGEKIEFNEATTPKDDESYFVIKPNEEKHDLIAEDAAKIAVELGLTPFLMGKKKLSYDEAVSLL